MAKLTKKEMKNFALIEYEEKKEALLREYEEKLKVLWGKHRELISRECEENTRIIDKWIYEQELEMKIKRLEKK